MYNVPAQNLGAYNTDRHLQNSVWSDFPYDQVLHEPTKWIYWFDDFTFVPSLTSATTAVNRWPYMSYIDTSNTIVALETAKTIGVLVIATDNTDNDGPIICLPGDKSVCFMLDDNTAADRRKMWQDYRWKKSSVTDNQAAVFLGLAEETRTVNDGLMTDDSAIVIATIDAIGFRVLQDNGEELDFTWQKASQTNQEIAHIATIANENSATTGLAADTYVKTGFKYDPKESTANRIKVYVNNKTHATKVTGTQMAAATFPDGEELVWYAGLKNGEGTACSLSLDWIRMAQRNLDV